jgi:AcrR family transcriptional regulator
VGRPPAGDSAETRRRILQAARIRFAHDGFRATTNRLIANDVGITTGALYHYTESKAELYAAVYCETIDEVYTEFESAAAEHDSLVSQFRAVMRRAADLQAADPSITGFIIAVAQETQRHPDLLELLTAQRGRHTRFFTGLAVAAAERGELGPDVDLRAVADLLGAVMTGLARTAAAAGDSSRYAAAVEILERVLDGSLVTRS